jgi:hypothetical protein
MTRTCVACFGTGLLVAFLAACGARSSAEVSSISESLQEKIDDGGPCNAEGSPCSPGGCCVDVNCNSKGVCSLCGQTDANCTKGSDCCNGICEKPRDRCGCAHNSALCHFDSDCCTGDTGSAKCDNGRCCGLGLGLCGADSDCCHGYRCDDFGLCCGSIGATCKYPGDCCDKVPCDHGVCGRNRIASDAGVAAGG